MLPEAQSSHAGEVPLGPEQVQPPGPVVGRGDLGQPVEEGGVGCHGLTDLLLRGSRVPPVPDRLVLLGARCRRTPQTCIEYEREDLGTRPQVGEHLGDRPGVVRRSLDVVAGQPGNGNRQPVVGLPQGCEHPST